MHDLTNRHTQTLRHCVVRNDDPRTNRQTPKAHESHRVRCQVAKVKQAVEAGKGEKVQRLLRFLLLQGFELEIVDAVVGVRNRTPSF